MLYITVEIELEILIYHKTYGKKGNDPVNYRKITTDSYYLFQTFQGAEDERAYKELVEKLKFIYGKAMTEYPLLLKISVDTAESQNEKLHTIGAWKFKSDYRKQGTNDIPMMDATTEKPVFVLTKENASEIAQTLITIANGEQL